MYHVLFHLDTQELIINLIISTNSAYIKGTEEVKAACNKADNPCNKHGLCRPIPHTNEYFCQCDPFYDGQKCDTFVNPSINGQVNKAIANLRLGGVKFLGVPNVIDVYQSIVGIKQRLSEMETRLVNVISHGQTVALGADIWVKVTYIAQQYHGLQTLAVTKKLFAQRMSGRDFHYILATFKNLVSGTVFGQQSDWMTSYKRKIAAESASQVCKTGFVQATDAMRKNIKAIDQIVTEAWLWTLKLNIESQPKDKQVRRFFFLVVWSEYKY